MNDRQPINALIWRPFWPGALYYSDIIERSVQPPDPRLDPDGIHLGYFRLQLALPFAVQPLHDDVIWEHIETILAEFRNWKNHSFKVDLSIEIAHLLMCLDRKEEAKAFLQFFKDSCVSENQMASCAREEMAALEVELA